MSLLSPSATAQPINQCKIQASSFKPVSLGFPVNPERLSKITNPKILVIPYRLKDENRFDFGSKEKEILSIASDNIYGISNGLSKVTFIYNSIIDLDMTLKERNSIKAPSNYINEWQERYDKSTWGFMKKFIIDQDKNIDFSGIDAVILFSSSTVVSAENAEAMMMTKDIYGPWFNPISTSEGLINNVIVIYNNFDIFTMTHEIMHLYGLTDLYGSLNRPDRSLMATDDTGILAFEKWILGWLPDSKVQCISDLNEIDQASASNQFTLKNGEGDQLIVIPTGSRTSLVVDSVKREDKQWLTFYSLDNEAGPPINTFISDDFDFSIEISSKRGIGTQIDSPDYILLISNNDDKNLSLNLIPKKLINSDAAKKLVSEANANAVIELKAKNEAKDKAALELKAKQEAEAKAATELKTMQDADAKDRAEKAATELKAKQDADAKAAADKVAAASKKTTITCVKGKLVKKVTAIKPVCPKGYKKK